MNERNFTLGIHQNCMRFQGSQESIMALTKEKGPFSKYSLLSVLTP